MDSEKRAAYMRAYRAKNKTEAKRWQAIKDDPEKHEDETERKRQVARKNSQQRAISETRKIIQDNE